MDLGQPRRLPRRRTGRTRRDWDVPAGGWFNLQDPFGPGRFERAMSRPGAAGFTVGMPNFPAVYAIRAALEYITGVGVEAIDQAARAPGAPCSKGWRGCPSSC